MNSLKYFLIIAVVLVFVTILITYFVRRKYYDQIDELDKQKKELFDQAPTDELKEASKLSLTGQSSELRDQFEQEWRVIESKKYPELEKHLFEAEEAADKYRLAESKKSQVKAEETIQTIRHDIEELTRSLMDLIKREQANLEKIDAIKKRYHEVRKSLLAYSFSFGPASESFEEKLSLMEEDFTEFSDYTVSGDHEEANKVIERLSENIQETEEEMEKVPVLLTRLNEDYEKDIEDLYQGYEQMTKNNYLFPGDSILEDIEQLKSQRNQILEYIRVLQLEEASDYTDIMGENIEEVYEKMEAEITAKPEVYELLKDIKQAVYFLQDESRRLVGIEQRLSQSYVLIHNEKEVLEKLEEKIHNALEEYTLLEEKISDNTLPYSVAAMRLNQLFKELSQLNDEKVKIFEQLENYRKEELRYKEELLAMEEAMYDMKRALENERLPGLPEDYLGLFFSTTNRIEALSEELSRTKILFLDVQKLHQQCEEDVIQLSRITEELIFKVNLIERVSQRLYRFKDSHKGILETIRYSETLFNNDYDYDTSLRLLREKLENVSPGSYEEMAEKVKKEQEEQYIV